MSLLIQLILYLNLNNQCPCIYQLDHYILLYPPANFTFFHFSNIHPYTL